MAFLSGGDFFVLLAKSMVVMMVQRLFLGALLVAKFIIAQKNVNEAIGSFINENVK